MRFKRFRAACARCYFAWPTDAGAYPGTVAASLPEAALDECRSDLSYVDRTAGSDPSDNNRRNQQKLKRGVASEGWN
jgi:hypothetical protein